MDKYNGRQVLCFEDDRSVEDRVCRSSATRPYKNVVEAPPHHFSPNAHITWREFTEAFRGVYIPPGLIEMKLGEFLALNQGTKTVT
jgi:hypothetical protein